VSVFYKQPTFVPCENSYPPSVAIKSSYELSLLLRSCASLPVAVAPSNWALIVVPIQSWNLYQYKKAYLLLWN